MRFAGSRNELVLAGRVRVKLSFAGVAEGEIRTGSGGRALPRKGLAAGGPGAAAHVAAGSPRGEVRGAVPDEPAGVLDVAPAPAAAGGGGSVPGGACGAGVRPGERPVLLRGPDAVVDGVLVGGGVRAGAGRPGCGWGWRRPRRLACPVVVVLDGVCVVRDEPDLPAGAAGGSGHLAVGRDGVGGGADAGLHALGRGRVFRRNRRGWWCTCRAGRSRGSTADHHVRVSVNGVEVGEATFAGKQPYRLERARSGFAAAGGGERARGRERGGHGGELAGVPGPVRGELPAGVDDAAEGCSRGCGRRAGRWRSAGLSGPACHPEGLRSARSRRIRRRSGSPASRRPAPVGSLPGGGGPSVPGGLAGGAALAPDRAGASLDAEGGDEPGGLPGDRAAGVPGGGAAAPGAASEPGAGRRGRCRSRRSRRSSGTGSRRRRRSGRSCRTRTTRGSVPRRGTWFSSGTRRTTRGASCRRRGRRRCRRCGRRRATCGRRRTRRSAAVNGEDLLPGPGDRAASGDDAGAGGGARLEAPGVGGLGAGPSGNAVLVADNPDVAGDFEADVEDIRASFLADRSDDDAEGAGAGERRRVRRSSAPSTRGRR